METIKQAKKDMLKLQKKLKIKFKDHEIEIFNLAFLYGCDHAIRRIEI